MEYQDTSNRHRLNLYNNNTACVLFRFIDNYLGTDYITDTD
jgi:hypothetical protein